MARLALASAPTIVRRRHARSFSKRSTVLGDPRTAQVQSCAPQGAAPGFRSTQRTRTNWARAYAKTHPRLIAQQ
jgi:hypothetical protein